MWIKQPLQLHTKWDLPQDIAINQGRPMMDHRVKGECSLDCLPAGLSLETMTTCLRVPRFEEYSLLRPGCFVRCWGKMVKGGFWGGFVGVLLVMIFC